MDDKWIYSLPRRCEIVYKLVYSINIAEQWVRFLLGAWYCDFVLHENQLNNYVKISICLVLAEVVPWLMSSSSLSHTQYLHETKIINAHCHILDITPSALPSKSQKVPFFNRRDVTYSNPANDTKDNPQNARVVKLKCSHR